VITCSHIRFSALVEKHQVSASVGFAGYPANPLASLTFPPEEAVPPENLVASVIEYNARSLRRRAAFSPGHPGSARQQPSW
jgi:hypothetical protein